MFEAYNPKTHEQDPVLDGKYLSMPKALYQCRKWQGEGQKVVIVDGCFDTIHHKHFGYLKAVKNLGDKLLVRLVSDEYIAQTKDPKGPLCKLDDRAKVIEHLPYVDAITSMHTGGLRWIDIYRPDIIVKSTTSGVRVMEEMTEFETLGHQPKIIFFDADNNIVAPENILEEARFYDETKYSPDKVSGSTMKKEIQDRFQERIAEEYLTCNI
jgi:cytidyltransferase-like protein